MKFFSFFILLFTIVACDPYGFGFKKNPAFVLDEAFKSINHLDVETFLEVTGKEALCVYGNEQGLDYLKNKMVLNPENVELKPQVLENEHLSAPKYVGYWSYYHERYQIKVVDKATSEVYLETIVDCEYGKDGEKDDRFINQKRERYKRKECKAIKLLPKKFPVLPLPEKCLSLKVEL